MTDPQQQGGGPAASLASLPVDATLLEGIPAPLPLLRRAFDFKATFRMTSILCWLFVAVMALIALSALPAALRSPDGSWDGHPWAFVAGAGAFAMAYGWIALRPNPWAWTVVLLGWIALLVYLGIPPEEAHPTPKERLLPFQGALFVLFQGYLLSAQIHYRDLKNPSRILSQLRLVKERMWLRSLDPGAPIASLTIAAPSSAGWPSAHLSRVEQGWFLLWGEEVCPLLPEELDLVDDEGRSRLRITLKDRMFLFHWPPERLS